MKYLIIKDDNINVVKKMSQNDLFMADFVVDLKDYMIIKNRKI